MDIKNKNKLPSKLLLEKEIYKYIEQENGDILLQKIILDDKKYNIINKENGDKILHLIIQNIDISDIKDIEKFDFSYSKILSCIINNEIIKKLKYHPILYNVYNIINDGTKIIQNKKINIKTIKQEKKEFHWIENLGISVQNVDANNCLFEIINQSIINKIKISIEIKLNDNRIININF